MQESTTKTLVIWDTMPAYLASPDDPDPMRNTLLSHLLWIAAVLLVVGLGCGTAVREAAPQRCVVRVYFCTLNTCGRAASKREIVTLSRRLGTARDVYSVRFVSKREALELMKKRFPDETATLASNPFPDSLRVRPVKGVAPGRIAAKIRGRRDGVQLVHLPRATDCG
jgi:cell division protein FtsX